MIEMKKKKIQGIRLAAEESKQAEVPEKLLDDVPMEIIKDSDSAIGDKPIDSEMMIIDCEKTQRTQPKKRITPTLISTLPGMI